MRFQVSGRGGCVAAIVFLGFSGSIAHAQSLRALIEVARTGEPGFLGARSNLEAAQAKQRQARGAFLPQVNLSVNTQANSRDYRTLDANGNGSFPEQHDSYNSRSAQLSMRLPLWRYGDIAGWRQSEAALAQAERQLDNAGQDLVLRVLTAWFDLLAARDQLAFAEQQERAAAKGWETVRRGAELGMASAAQLEGSRAEYDRAAAEQVGAEAEIGARLAALEQLVGPIPELHLPLLRQDAALPAANSAPLDEWTQLAETHNPALLAAQRAFDAASEEVPKARGGHAPSLELTSTISRNKQAVGGFPGQLGYDITQGSVGVELNVPLYSGGIQSARVDEAIAGRERARHDMEAARRAAVLNARQAWWAGRAASARLRSGKQAIEAAALAVRTAEVGARGGLKSEYDRLAAQKDWFAARRDWSHARYDLMMSEARLRAVAGQFGDSDIAAIDAAFVIEAPQMFATRTAAPPAESPSMFRPVDALERHR